MPAVTIEQNLESRQTYLRLRDVGHLLQQPRYRIGGDSNEMLGPEGWKNQDIVNEARQCLDGRDLLLEIDSRLINYIEPGRAIEVQIDELKFSERIPTPPLMSFPSSKASPPPGAEVYKFVKPSLGGGTPDPVVQKRADVEQYRPSHAHDDEQTRIQEGTKGDHRRPPFAPDMDDLTRNISDDEETDRGDEAEDRTKLIDGQEHHEPSDEAEDDEHTRAISADEADEPEADPAPQDSLKSEVGSVEDEHETAPRPNWRSIAAAILFGLIVGFFAKYITDEYVPWPNQSSPGTNRKMALVQTDAFGPLSEDLKQMPEKSPLGLAPDDLPEMSARTINRGRSFFNYGAQKALEHKNAEAIYWYKRSVKMIEPDALTFLGDGYLNGDGVPRDARTGYQLLRLGAALGSEKARNYLADRLESGSIPNAPTTMGQAFRPR